MSDEALASPTIDIERVRARRASVRKAYQRVQELLAGVPLEERTPPAELSAAVATLAEHWETHVRSTESVDGIIAQIVTDAPRLSTTASRLQGDHAVITGQIRKAQELLAAVDVDLPAVRAQLDTAIEGIERHRRSGNTLIHDAYNLDIGLGE
jgi:hypothetical protein